MDVAPQAALPSPASSGKDRRARRLDGASGLGLVAFLLLPWYGVEGGMLASGRLADWPFETAVAPGLLQIGLRGAYWLLPLAAALAGILALRFAAPGATRGSRLAVLGAAGLLFLVVEGLSVGYQGWNWLGWERLFGALDDGQPPFGLGAFALALSFLLVLAFGLAEKGWLRGDAFVIAAIASVVALVASFVLYPLASLFIGAFQSLDGTFDATSFLANVRDPSIWSIACFSGSGACGLAWRTVFLALCTGLGTTVLGLAFALVATRTRFPFKKLLRLLTILPIITPPFVIGLALILLFGRSGVVTQTILTLSGYDGGRWLYGLTGIWIAQMLSFTPIAFMVLIGVVEGISPSMEEAAQTMRADRWRTFWTVSFPLMRPGLANAFLVGFIESMADFGNPLVLGGSHGVLSTEIFFAVVGAQNDPARAAVLALVLLAFTLSAFFLQRLWLKGRSYTTVTGKGDAGRPGRLDRKLAIGVHAMVVPWILFTVAVYAMIVFGSFVRTLGLDDTLTLDHYAKAFSVAAGANGLRWTGVAWDSFWTTLEIALIAAPLTAAVGLLSAWLLVRQRFAGREALEFLLMLSFAIPGTVIGVSYVLAFNLPPIEMTGTAIILVICFVFRNMPVGVRGGIAAMSQLDRSLDEASLTLGANSFTTLRRVVLPLLRPAIVAALVYSFVRSITSISAVIFLVSAEYNMATSYIVGLTENGEYGVAIAYSTVLIAVMVVVIALFQLLVGKRTLRRDERKAVAVPAAAIPQEMPA